MSNGTLRVLSGADAALTLGKINNQLPHVKQNLQVLHGHDDELIKGLMQAAIELLENNFNICIYRKQLTLNFERFEPKLTLKNANNCTLEKIEYTDTKGDLAQVPVGHIRMMQDMPNFEHITHKRGAWPAHDSFLGDVVVTYSAGWLEIDKMPACISQCIKLIVGDWYKTRADSDEKKLHTLPNGVATLMRRYVSV